LEGVRSMIAYGYDVDVYLICAFELTPERQQLLQDALPPSVGLQVWDDAVPLTYNMKDIQPHTNSIMTINNANAKLEHHSRGLARQHRFVLKDKLHFYDAFVTFEDDMLVKGPHVKNYLDMTDHLAKLREQAPVTEPFRSPHLRNLRFSGPLTRHELERLIPGFVRVEVLLNETQSPIPPLAVQIPVDPEHLPPRRSNGSSSVTEDNNNNNTTNGTLSSMRLLQPVVVDASPCCHVSSNMATNSSQLPTAPSLHQLILWETQIVALGVRQMPPLCVQTIDNGDKPQSNMYSLDWVTLQRGTDPDDGLSDYWSGNDGYYRNDTVYWRPATYKRKYLNNQGGYIATQQQLVEWHTHICESGFLPPFDGDDYGNMDGLDLRDVEYWSGGIQLIDQCGLQRMINLDPHHFGSHILYHTANNKQVQLQHVKERFTRLDDLYGMLTTTRKNAERAMVELATTIQENTEQVVESANHNVSKCIVESPMCFPPLNQRGECIVEKALACLLGRSDQIYGETTAL
jgi:hypothetical protein